MAQPQYITPLKTPTIDKPVAVDVILGQAQHCLYTVELYDAKGENGVVIGDGNNLDPDPDTWPIPNQAPGLAGRVLGWTITITAPDDSPGQRYSAEIVVREGNTPLAAQPIRYRGDLSGTRIIMGFGKFS